MNIYELVANWLTYKEDERASVEQRRAIEDEIAQYYRINPQDEGTKNFEEGKFKVKIVSKLSRTVDSDKLQEIAAEAGLTDELSRLFKWKADIHTASWKTAPEQVKAVLSEAITTKAGRPTFSIETKGE